MSVGKQDQSPPPTPSELFLRTYVVFQMNPVSKQFGVSDICNFAPFHQRRHFNYVQFIFHLHPVLSYYWSVSDESSYRKKQKIH